MPRVSHLRLALVGAALAVPAPAWAGDSPRAVASTSSGSTKAAQAGQVVVMDDAQPVPLDHKHSAKVKKGLARCEKCAAAAKAGRVATVTPPTGTFLVAPDGSVRQLQGPAPASVAVAGTTMPAMAGMPAGSRIVGCAHSSRGVCATCKALLEMPGEVMTVAPAAPAATVASAPGRAVATDSAPGRAVVAGEPEPIGVMRTAYAPAGAPPMARPAQPTMPPQPGRTPFLGEQTETKANILGHLFGFATMGRDIQDKLGESKRKARERHAAISYDNDASKVEDLPASMVYGRGGPR